jgi:hypothetical protein
VVHNYNTIPERHGIFSSSSLVTENHQRTDAYFPAVAYYLDKTTLLKDEVLLTVGCPIFPPFYIDNQISVHRKLKKNRSNDI